ncbi:hypothetical protein A2W24_03375 [Microgenomates group bacterium RBG_16_45_19]|nr:MAG: hypothetical protein A2W24_03375 [Microgenomates group bacterium RBG_16_45_19]
MVSGHSPFTKKVHAGISIHANAVRGVSLTSTGAINRSAEIIFPQPILESDITNPQALIQAFQRLKTEAGFTSAYVAVCFPEKYAFSRQYRLPKLMKHEIAEAVNWQIDKIFPFPKEDIYVDWKLLELTTTYTLVLVTAVPKNLLDHLRLCLEHAGLYPISFEPSASAISRMLTTQPAEEAIILELETNNACVTLVYRGTSLTTSTFNLTPATNLPSLMTLISQSITAMVQKYLQKGGANQTVRVYLTGEKASPQMVTYLAQFIRLPLTLFTVPGVTSALHLAYIAAKTYVLPPPDDRSINLLPTELQALYVAQLKQAEAKHGLTTGLMLALPSLVLCAVLWLATVVYGTTINRQIAALQTNASQPNLAGLNLAEINQNAHQYLNLFPLKTSPESLLDELYRTVPPSIQLHHITYDVASHTLTLTGLAQTRADLIEYKTALEQLAGIDQVGLPLSALEAIDNVTFSLNLKLVSSL